MNLTSFSAQQCRLYVILWQIQCRQARLPCVTITASMVHKAPPKTEIKPVCAEWYCSNTMHSNDISFEECSILYLLQVYFFTVTVPRCLAQSGKQATSMPQAERLAFWACCVIWQYCRLMLPVTVKLLRESETALGDQSPWNYVNTIILYHHIKSL